MLHILLYHSFFFKRKTANPTHRFFIKYQQLYVLNLYSIRMRCNLSCVCIYLSVLLHTHICAHTPTHTHTHTNTYTYKGGNRIEYIRIQNKIGYRSTFSKCNFIRHFHASESLKIQEAIF